MYAHVTGTEVDQVGTPPRLAYVGDRWWDLRSRTPAVLAVAGWFEVVTVSKPADTPEGTYEQVLTFADGAVTQSWTYRPWTPEEQTALASASNDVTLRDRAALALDTNTADIAQADTLIATVTPLQTATFANNTQRDNAIKTLAQATRILGEQNKSQAKHLNTLIRLVVGLTEAID
jgi:hypothetical protein